VTSISRGRFLREIGVMRKAVYRDRMPAHVRTQRLCLSIMGLACVMIGTRERRRR